MTAPLTGGCTCGAVRYECTADSVMAFNCHCRDCQRATRGAYVSAVVIPRNALRVPGQVSYFDVREASEQTLNRGLCPKCDSRRFRKTDFTSHLMVAIV